MLIVFIAALLGIWRYRSGDYFRWVAIASAWMLASSFLFQAGGTLEDPSGDGWITHQVRLASSDGPEVALLGIGVLIAYYGGLIFFVMRMRTAARQHVGDGDALEADAVASNQSGRKTLETIGLIAAFVGYVWFVFVSPPERADAAETRENDLGENSASVPSSLTVEQEMLGVAVEMNATLPQIVDQITTLERVTVSGRTLTYHYQIEAKAEDRARLEKYLRTDVVPKVCTGTQREEIRSEGVAYVYRYTSKGFADPLQLLVDEALCSSLEG